MFGGERFTLYLDSQIDAGCQWDYTLSDSTVVSKVRSASEYAFILDEKPVSSGREELIGNALHRSAWVEDVSEDCREILYVKVNAPSKLVLVENLFD
jgi:hypothetical protein